jgi:hypothetical protein
MSLGEEEKAPMSLGEEEKAPMSLGEEEKAPMSLRDAARPRHLLPTGPFDSVIRRG